MILAILWRVIALLASCVAFAFVDTLSRRILGIKVEGGDVERLIYYTIEYALAVCLYEFVSLIAT
jgi:hypothetical protein